MMYVAEYVSPGHPDRLADFIVERCVDLAESKDSMSYVNLKCAINDSKVYLYGRIACGNGKECEITEDELKKEISFVNVFSNFSKTEDFKEIVLDVKLEPLKKNERKDRIDRIYGGEQNIIVGYAEKSPNTNYLPAAHFLVNYIGEEIAKNLSSDEKYKCVDPNFKILICLKEENEKLSFDKFEINIISCKKKEFDAFNIDLFDMVQEIIQKIKSKILPNIIPLDYCDFYSDCFYKKELKDLLGHSGNRLTLDFYGPTVPIGGKSISGKDNYNADVAGAFRARQLAVDLVQKYGYEKVYVYLSWSSYGPNPFYIQAFSEDEFGTKMVINPKLLPEENWFTIETILKEYKTLYLYRYYMVEKGYMNSFL